MKYLRHGWDEPCMVVTMRLHTPYHAGEMRYEATVGGEALTMSSEEWRDLGCPEEIAVYIAVPSRKPIIR